MTRMKSFFQVKIIALFIILSVSACSSTLNAGIESSSTHTITPNAIITTTGTVIQIPSQEVIKEITPTMELTPTADTRLLPEDWKNWPIIPEVTNRTVEIYIIGLEKGVNPKSFSKIGDCQFVSESFMGIYDRKNYYLQDWQSEWQETSDNFKGYFFRDGYAFKQGLNSAAALSPLHADPDNCLPNEGPVQCELRIVNPSYAFIRFERWYPDITPPEEYEKYLRQVIDLVIDNGTVPILVTKADNIEGEHKINLIIAKLAYEYDIPLFNWWKAAQTLPNRGMDPERHDGFHIDPKFAWTEQSIYGLGTLDFIWKGTKGN